MEVVFTIIIVDVICASFCYFLALQKNRRGGSWCILGLFFGLIALLTLVGTPVKEKEVQVLREQTKEDFEKVQLSIQRDTIS
jgi:hypothetical protein